MHLSTTLRYWYLPWFIAVLFTAVTGYLSQDFHCGNTGYQLAPSTPVPPASGIKAETPPTAQPVITAAFFPGCEEERGRSKRKCSDEAMYNWIYNEVGYPAGNPQHKTAGVAVINILIGADGTLRDPRIVSGPPHGRAEDALRVINNMRARGIKWEPATYNGAPIALRTSIRIHYNMVWAGKGQ